MAVPTLQGEQPHVTVPNFPRGWGAPSAEASIVFETQHARIKKQTNPAGVMQSMTPINGQTETRFFSPFKSGLI